MRSMLQLVRIMSVGSIVWPGCVRSEKQEGLHQVLLAATGPGQAVVGILDYEHLLTFIFRSDLPYRFVLKISKDQV